MNTLDENMKFRRKVFERALATYGPTLKAIHYGDKESQSVRFEVLGSIGDLNNCALLDVGCGFGDFAGYIYREEIKPKRYIGIDIVEGMVREASVRYPDFEFQVSDIFSFSVKQYDYVIASGLFGLEFPDWHSYVRTILTKMFEVCKVGMGVNFLSRTSKSRMPGVYYAAPSRVLDMAFVLSSKVVLRHDYRVNDFTVFIYK